MRVSMCGLSLPTVNLTTLPTVKLEYKKQRTFESCSHTSSETAHRRYVNKMTLTVLTSYKEECTADAEQQSEAEGDSADMVFGISPVDFEGHVCL